MREVCEARGIPHDIEWSDEKRLYGDAWYEFTGSCRANLGSETGSNVFDLDGSIERSTKRSRPRAARRCRLKNSASTPTRSRPISTSGRFAANFRSCRTEHAADPILRPVFEPDRARRTLYRAEEGSLNVDAVLERLQDVDGLERMAERTYRHLVASGEYAYRRFAKLVDDTVARKAEELGQGLRVPMGRSRPGHYNPTARASLLEVSDSYATSFGGLFRQTHRAVSHNLRRRDHPAKTKSIRPRSHV